MFFLLGPGVYNDSDQYIKMHIHRVLVSGQFSLKVNPRIATLALLTGISVLIRFLTRLSAKVLMDIKGLFDRNAYQEGYLYWRL